MNHDPLPRGLAGLAAEAPPALLDRIAARWVQAEGPLGEVFVACTEHGIAYLRPAEPGAAEGFRARFGRPLLPAQRVPEGLPAALRSGSAEGLDFDLGRLSAFQTDVLRAAQAIPPGEVRPYTWIARRIGRPRAVRAIGSALGANPVPLLIPCHRVVRADGAPGGYIFGSEAKETLLRREGVDLEGVRALATAGRWEREDR